MAVTTFASTIGREALPVALRDGGAHRAPGAHLFLDAFEDDDVRVRCDAERQHEAGESRERQRDIEEEDRGVEEGRVDSEPDDGHDAEEAVEESRKIATSRRPPIAAFFASSSESCPSVAEMSVRR